MSASGSNSTSSKKDDVPMIRVAVMGPAGVGKTAMVVKLLSGRFIWNYDPTLESVHRHNLIDTSSTESSTNAVKPPNKYLLEVMDTAGTADKDLKICSYVKWADAIVLVYSITEGSSFGDVKRLRDNIYEIKKLGLSVTIVGNKVDLEHFRKVAVDEVEKYAADNECPFYELSAKMDLDRVRGLFCDICKDVVSSRIKAGIKLRRRSSASLLLRKLIQKKLSI